MRSSEGGPADGQDGFTLIETLTALTILAIAVVSLFEAQATGLRSVGAAADYAKARILAQSLLAETVATWRGGSLVRSGADAGFNWSIDVARSPYVPEGTNAKWRLHQIHVAVAWRAGRHIELATLKLGRVKE